MESIKATLLSVRYRSPERNWLIATMKDSFTRKSFMATGDIPYSETEEPVQLYGDWVEDKKYGRQFKVVTSHRILPTTISGLRNYLAASEDIKGVGPVRANLLTDYFNAELITILDRNPEKLSDCPGISVEIARRIASGWKQDSILRQVSLFLAARGISPRWAGRILKQWDSGTAISRITENPYSLTQIEGIGFITADEMAQTMGWKKDAPERVEAACTYALLESIQDGNVFLHEGELIEEVIKLTHPRIRSEEATTKAEVIATEALSKVIRRKELIVEEVSDGVLNLKLVYLPKLYRAEKELAERIAELNRQHHDTPRNLERVLTEVQKNAKISFSPKQVNAIRAAFSNRTLVITGGPGTGKTTCTRAICEVATALGMETTLCASTGRAAKRLSDVTGHTATTIHRLLKWRDDGPVHTRRNPIGAELLIIDESSMLDLELASKLFEAVPSNCSVVFIGDIDQLPAIGAGNTLRDIILSKCVCTHILETVFRQAESSLIVRNAHLIRKGEMPRFPMEKGAKEDAFVMWIPTNSNKEITGRDDAEWLKEKLSRLVSVNIPEKFSNSGRQIDPIRDIQVLVPMKKHTLGANELNRVLQKALNPNGKEFFAGGRAFRIGDRVMQMRNNYSEGMDVYNGDIGFVVKNKPEDKHLEVDFDDRHVLYPYTELGDLHLAYATTIHKGQGSEYPIVVVVLAYQHWPMLERNLIYTANTRAKELCIFMTSKGAIEHAVKNNPVRARNSYLAQRLRIHSKGEGTCRSTSQV